MTYSLFNSSILLFGSWNSLRVDGLIGFQYSELAFSPALPFLIIVYTEDEEETNSILYSVLTLPWRDSVILISKLIASLTFV